MYRILLRGLLVSCLAAAAATCSNSNNTSTTPTTPTTAGTTETFSGTLNTNGAATHPFTATGSGTVNAVLTTLTSDSPLTVSFALGTWNGTVCQIILANDNAAQAAVVTGSVSTASTLCVRIADAKGTVPGPTPYVITVSHP